MTRRTTLLAAVAVLLALACSTAALGRSAADDLTLTLVLQGSAAGAKVVTGPSFTLATVVDTNGGVQAITLRLILPSGIRLAADAPSTLGCSGTTTIVCTTRLQQGNIVFFQYDWGLVARDPGTYDIVASVEGERPDPNQADNEVNFRFEVKAAPGSGGGGSASVAVSAVRLSPAKPKAGSPVIATASVTAGGSKLKPSKVVCAGTLAGKKAIGTGKAATGLASCRYPTPKSAKGKTLAGSMAITAKGKTITKRFSAKLG